MPKTPINYENACIYKICCKDTNITDCYIGSTTNFKQRKSGHKRCCSDNNKRNNVKVYNFIRENGEWDNWDMVLVEKVNVNDGNELRKEERKWIEQLNATLNSSIPTRTQKEWFVDNEEKMKQYRIDNKDKIKEKDKKHYEKNKEKYIEYSKKYTEKNKKEVYKKKLEKVECPNCKSMICRTGLSKHKKTKKCMNAK